MFHRCTAWVGTERRSSSTIQGDSVSENESANDEFGTAYEIFIGAINQPPRRLRAQVRASPSRPNVREARERDEPRTSASARPRLDDSCRHGADRAAHGSPPRTNPDEGCAASGSGSRLADAGSRAFPTA